MSKWYSSFWFDRKSSVDDILGYDLDTGIILVEALLPLGKEMKFLIRYLLGWQKNLKKK